MMEASLSPQLALRIGLASRALPGVTPAGLVAHLIEILRLPLTDQKLKGITFQQLRNAGNGEMASIPVPILKSALDYLWDRQGVDIIDDTLPPVVTYRTGEMPKSVRIALASDGGEVLNGHFGNCMRFLVYQVSAEKIRLIDVRGTASGKKEKNQGNWRAELLRDCHLVQVLSVNVQAMAALMKIGIFPVKSSSARPARDVLKEIQLVLQESPPPWLGKAMGLEEQERWHFPRPVVWT